MSEGSALEKVSELIESIDKDKKALEEKIDEIDQIISKLQDMVYVPYKPNGEPPREFQQEAEFLKLMDALGDAAGLALDLVMSEEEKNLKSSELQTQPTEKGNAPQQIIVQAAPQQQSEEGKSKGLFASLFDYKKFKLKMQREAAEKPRITESKEVRDVLEFGRQINPTINEIKNYFSQSLAHLRVYQDPELYFQLHEDLKTHISKLIGVIRSFVRAYTERRKRELDRTKVEVGKSMSGIAQAEAMTSAGQRVIVVPEDFRRRRLP